MNEGDEKKEERVAFTPDQQARVQELIDSAYKRAYAKATSIGGRKEEVRRLEDELDRFKEYQKNTLLATAISSHNVVDALEIAELIAPRLSFNEEGALGRVDEESNFVHINTFVDDWLSQRPHHLKKEEGQE